MGSSMENRPSAPSRKPRFLLHLALMGTLSACASGLRIYPIDVPAGALRVGEVASLANKKDIKAMEQTYKALLSSGIKDSELGNRSFGAARVFCCGGPDEKSSDIFFYIPGDIKVELGDIVEIRSGHHPKDGTPGRPNTAVRVVEKRESKKSCDWDPPGDYLWNKVIYCEWMPGNGWTAPQGVYKVWYKLER